MALRENHSKKVNNSQSQQNAVSQQIQNAILHTQKNKNKKKITKKRNNTYVMSCN